MYFKSLKDKPKKLLKIKKKPFFLKIYRFFLANRYAYNCVCGRSVHVMHFLLLFSSFFPVVCALSQLVFSVYVYKRQKSGISIAKFFLGKRVQTSRTEEMYYCRGLLSIFLFYTLSLTCLIELVRTLV